MCRFILLDQLEWMFQIAKVIIHIIQLKTSSTSAFKMEMHVIVVMMLQILYQRLIINAINHVQAINRNTVGVLGVLTSSKVIV